MQIPGPSYPAPRLPGTISIIEEALRKEEKVFHLQRVIEDAQTQLETIIKEEAIAHEVAKTQPSLVEMRERFDKHVLELYVSSVLDRDRADFPVALPRLDTRKPRVDYSTL